MPTSGSVLSNRYRLEDEIGRGGMGVVYRAFDQELEIPVAIKLLPLELSSSKRAINDLKREAVLAMRLRHPGIMGLYHFDDAEDVKYLVMELLLGQTLEDHLADAEAGYLPADEIASYAVLLADAVDYAHSERVVHRDIKPNNIFLHERDDTISPRIMDFGIARQIKDSMSRVSNRDSSGTLFYMSPEQLQGRAVDGRADVYSLAATFYECLCGNPPFHRGSISYQIVNSEPEPIPHLPDFVNAALLKGLAKDPANRYPTAQALAAGLSAPPTIAVDDGDRSVSSDELERSSDSSETRAEEIRRQASEESHGDRMTGQGDATAAAEADDATDEVDDATDETDEATDEADDATDEVDEAAGDDDDVRAAEHDGSPVSPVASAATQPSITAMDPSPPQPSIDDTPSSTVPQKSCLQRGCSCLFYAFCAVLAFSMFCYYLDQAGYLDGPRPTKKPTRYRPPQPTRYRPSRPTGHRPPPYRPGKGPLVSRPTTMHHPSAGQHGQQPVKHTKAAELAALALNRAAAGKGAETYALLSRLKSLDPALLENVAEVPMLLAAKGQFQSAIDGLLLFERASLDPDVWTQLGKEALEANVTAPASKCFAKAIHLDQQHVEALYWQAVICSRKGKTTKAVTLLRRALRSDSTHGPSRELLQRLDRHSDPAPPSHQPAQNPLQQTPLQQVPVIAQGRAILLIDLKVQKEREVHVKEILLHLEPADGRRGRPEWQQIEPRLVERSHHVRSYRKRLIVPRGTYRIGCTVDGLYAPLGLKLIPRRHDLGLHTLTATDMRKVLTFQVQAPTSNETAQ